MTQEELKRINYAYDTMALFIDRELTTRTQDYLIGMQVVMDILGYTLKDTSFSKIESKYEE